MAMSFVAKYPDRTEIIPELIETGIEELEHRRGAFVRQFLCHEMPAIEACVANVVRPKLPDWGR